MSLIVQAKGGDAQAWKRLTDLYGVLVYRWARRSGLQDADAADVMQDVFRDVARAIGDFRKEKPGDSFRAWLRTITKNRLRRFFNQQSARPDAIGGTDAHRHLQHVPNAAVPDVEADESNERAIVVHRAIEMLRDEFQQRTWKAFWRLAVAGESAADIGADLGMNEKAVRQAKYRVLCRLKELLIDD